MFRNFVVVAFCVLAGCASNGPVRPQNLKFPLAGSMDVEVRLLQHQMIVSHANSVVGGAAGLQLAATPNVAAAGFAAGAAAGLVGSLVDAAIDAHRQSVANDAVKPMREHMAGVDLDALVYQSVDDLDKKLFAPSIQVERLTQPEDADARVHALQEGTNILVLVPSYSVSYDGQAFTYVLSAKLIDRARNSGGWVAANVKYQQLFEYIVTKDSLPAGSDWNKLDADQWKAMIGRAANETVQMLNYDIAANAEPAKPEMKYGRLTLHLDQTRGDRSWAHTNFAMLSLPSAVLKPIGHS